MDEQARDATKARDMAERRLLGGRYELDGVVGRGGMAEIYRARDLRLGRIVAVKTLREDLAGDPTFQARFRREAQSAASLNHPSIVAVYDTGEDRTGEVPVPYIVMEYADGRTLADLLGEAGGCCQAGRWRSPRECCALLTTVTATASCTATSSHRT
jgi:hypothetical protein